jgi:ferrous iron transport protein B
VVHSLIIDGVFAGVGSVLSFLPIIVVLFFFLSILEDTGYMARVAFVMDRLLRRIGLSGRSFVPMLIGFGCSVPAIMATRTVSSDRDRKMTILLTPYMSCSAKIPIYAVFTAAFFPKDGALVMICLYITRHRARHTGGAAAEEHRLPRQPVPFVMELPNYRLPSAKSVGCCCGKRPGTFCSGPSPSSSSPRSSSGFCRPSTPGSTWSANSAASLLAIIGRLIAPVFAPLGFADWRIATALVSGFTAKEAVVSTLTVLLDTGMSQLPARCPACSRPSPP